MPGKMEKEAGQIVLSTAIRKCPAIHPKGSECWKTQSD